MPMLSTEDADYISKLLKPAEGLTDREWQAACCSLIADDPKFRGHDPHDVWCRWIQVTEQ
jgi:hypothetical protein